MKLYALVRFTKYLFLAFLFVALGVQPSVYANILDHNQCAKLFDVQKQKLSFKELVNQKIRAAQEAQARSAVEQKAEEAKRKETERKKRQSIYLANLDRKIEFVEIQPIKFVMGEGEKKVDVEITKPYGIMDRKMTQLMYARLMELMGFKDLKDIFPSHYTDGDNSILYEFNGKEIPMRPDDPVTNVSWDDINNVLIPILNKLSSEDLNYQSRLKTIIPDHQKGDVYDFVTDTQMENVLRLAKTEDGDSIDSMIMRHDLEKLKKYIVFDQNTDEVVGTLPEASLLPLYIGARRIYLQGNVWELTKDHLKRDAVFIGGKDPIHTSGNFRSIRGGCWADPYLELRSAKRDVAFPFERGNYLGFRLARVSRGGMHTNVGGTP